MRKLIFYGLLICFVFISCTKTKEIIDSTNPITSKTIDFFANNKESRDLYLKEIANAKDFFENHIITSASQIFKKTPIWERASNAKMASGAEKVLVPLKYDKEYSFKTSFSGDKKFTLEKQSFLSIYKDASGNYQAEVITIYPDESSLNDVNQPFQGLLAIDDWNENRIKTYLHKDGKLYNVQNSQFNWVENSSRTSGRTNEVCLTVDWYWCEGSGGNITCTYLLTTEYENCADFQSLEPPGEGGEYVYEYDVAKWFNWIVESNAIGGSEVRSWDRVKGKRRSNWPEGGYITTITHNESWCYCHYNAAWHEESTSSYEVLLNGLKAKAIVVGHINYLGTNYPYSNTNEWFFSDL